MTNIVRVHVVFKTHLDIGFTHLAQHVTKQYREEYISKAIELAERLEAESGGNASLILADSSLLELRDG